MSEILERHADHRQLHCARRVPGPDRPRWPRGPAGEDAALGDIRSSQNVHGPCWVLVIRSGSNRDLLNWWTGLEPFHYQNSIRWGIVHHRGQTTLVNTKYFASEEILPLNVIVRSGYTSNLC